MGGEITWAVWLLAGLLLLVVVVWVLVAIHARRQRQRDGRPEGITGWLVIPAAQLVLGPLAIFASIGTEIEVLSMEGSSPEKTALHILIGLSLVFALWIIYVAIRFFEKKSNAPRLYKSVLILYWISPLIQYLVFSLGIDLSITPFLIAFAIQIIPTLIFFSYINVSKRVANTFTR
ncbi:DUF2569 family protein [Bauldia sp.]|uniref:DUF2569 family protein n=1 Tax=Bauldia sp. TaxID=2575872 RepID=UPI003BAA92EB